MRTYKVGYAVVPGEKTKEELAALSLGGADQVIIHSIIGKAGNGEPRSEAIVSLDGHTGKPVTDEEMFESWVLTAKAITQSSLGENTKAVANMVFELIRKVKIGRCLHPALFVKPYLHLLPNLVGQCMLCGEDVPYVDLLAKD